MASAKSSPPPAASPAPAARSPASTRSIGSGTPITPVEPTATCAGSRPVSSAASSCIRAASRRPAAPVAALALPELTATARSAARSQRSRQSSTGAAWVPERVKRAALVASGESQASSATSRSPLGLMPAATPAARNPAGRPSTSRTWPGASTQREAKKELVAFTRSPPPRAARTSG